MRLYLTHGSSGTSERVQEDLYPEHGEERGGCGQMVAMAHTDRHVSDVYQYQSNPMSGALLQNLYRANGPLETDSRGFNC